MSFLGHMSHRFDGWLSDVLFCFCKQKTAYEMRISDWSSDVCSSDLAHKLNDGACRTGLTPAGWDLEHGLALTRGERFAEKVDRLLLVRPKLDHARPPRITSKRVRSSSCALPSLLTNSDRKSTRLNSSH